MSFLKKAVLFLALLCFCLVVLISQIIYDKLQTHKYQVKQNYLKKVDEMEAEDMDEDSMLHKFRKTYSMEDKIADMSKMIKHINEKQRIRNARKLGLKESYFETVLVVKVHNNIRQLAVFLDSIRKMKYITRSLLIFAHDFYDIEMNLLLKRMSFVRTMQIFYPYSSQLYPDMYPGKDARFCTEIKNCISSTQRNATLAQSKLFWWWVTSQVFEHINVLKKYQGFIYFVESEQYLTSDFIHMAKMLEKLQTLFCPECRLLSLASHPPRPEQYTQNNNTLVVDAWGPTFSSSAIGFNRRTWYEIKYSKQEFCSFNDSSWDNSLRYLVSTTQEQKFLMLSPEGPRAFSTKGCGELNGTECSLDRIFLDILEFLPTIEEGLFPEYFKLKVGEAELNGTIEGGGEWEDARDKEFCLYIANRASEPVLTTPYI